MRARIMRLNQVTLPAIDVAACRDFYLEMGFVRIVDGPGNPDYVRLKAPRGDTTLSIQKQACLPDGPCPKIYLECDSAAALDENVHALRAQGMAFELAPADQRWLWREAWLRDPAGNRVCLYFAGENRLNPPWRVT